jgi:GT2 family glycosyltransferase
LLDADDEWLTGYIAEVCRLMEYYPDAAAYSTAFYIVDQKRRIKAATPTAEGYINPAKEALASRYPIIPSTATLSRAAIERIGGFPDGMRIGEDQWVWIRLMQAGERFCFSPMPLVRYSRISSNRSASIYRSESSHHSIAELYDSTQEALLNEYVARVGIGKAITQSVRGGTEDARKAIRDFSYTTIERRQLRRLRLLNALPEIVRPYVDILYSSLAWLIKRRGA